MILRLRMNMDAMTWDELDAMDAASMGESVSTRTIRSIVAKAMLDEDGERMDFDEAYQSLGELTYPQILEAVQQLDTSLTEDATSAVPPAKSGGSLPPSGTADTERPGGSASYKRRKSGVSRRGKS